MEEREAAHGAALLHRFTRLKACSSLSLVCFQHQHVKTESITSTYVSFLWMIDTLLALLPW